MSFCRETVWDTSNDGIQYAKLEKADRIYDFLVELNPNFDTVCCHILGQRPFPSLMEVCFEVRLEENRTNVMGVLTTPALNLLALVPHPRLMIITRIMGNRSLFVSTTRNSGTSRINVGNSMVIP
ncbi:UBN2_3 domain-containing protein [Cucumis melo var. makuwa]|uniref:UBN2_3 domain-containing protein n=1 Tax=Cucumis melo var. makuwa TaxID=1194695 RepID=A0A5D3C376_CUCMM|nr:UBN2_3 domain-containing protein [Cucumis melo var. makuwa]